MIVVCCNRLWEKLSDTIFNDNANPLPPKSGGISIHSTIYEIRGSISLMKIDCCFMSQTERQVISSASFWKTTLWWETFFPEHILMVILLLWIHRRVDAVIEGMTLIYTIHKWLNVLTPFSCWKYLMKLACGKMKSE